MVNKILLMSALIGAACIGWYLSNTTPVSQSTTPTQTFVIPKGQSTRTILRNLQSTGIIKSSLAAEIYLYLNQQRGQFQAGSFKLNPSMTLKEIANTLKTGTLDIWITIPEGWRAEQIVDELKNQGLLENINSNELYQLFRQSEGKLFPETYLFAKDSSADQIISRMIETFSQKTNNQQPAGQSLLGQSPLDGVWAAPITNNDIIAASLVEREARHDVDRPLIASVLQNRLRIGMALQIDATLQYAKADSKFKVQKENFDWWEPVGPADKNINSTYNTYKYPGLPPGPIANPGIEAIKAVLNPAKTDYLYYVSEPDGTTHFAKDLEGHNANIKKYLMR